MPETTPIGLKGSVLNVPNESVEAFLLRHPDAERTLPFQLKGQKLNVPKSYAEPFQARHPSASLINPQETTTTAAAASTDQPVYPVTPEAKELPYWLERGIVQPLYNAMGGTQQAAANITNVFDQYASSISDVTGIEKPKAFEELRTLYINNAKYYHDRGVPKEQGFFDDLTRLVYGGAGQAAVDIPLIMATPGGLPVFSAIMGGAVSKEEGQGVLRGLIKGGVEGLALKRSLHAFGGLDNIYAQIAGGGGTFGALQAIEELKSDDPDWTNVTAQTIVGIGLTAPGIRTAESRQQNTMNQAIARHFKEGEQRFTKFLAEQGVNKNKGRELFRRVEKQMQQESKQPPELLVDTKGRLKQAKETTKKVGQEWLTSRGLLPKEVEKLRVQKEGLEESYKRQITFTLRDFNRAARDVYGRFGLSEEHLRTIDQVIKGEMAVEILPEPLQSPVKRMRTEVDALSQKMIDEGVVEGRVAETVEANKGFYLTRSYRAFDDPNWSKKVPEEVRTKAKGLIREEYLPIIAKEWAEKQKVDVENISSIQRKMTQPGTPEWKYFEEQRIPGIIENLLYEGKAENSPIALIQKGKLGHKDLSILQKRKEIAPEIRALFGEYEDPRVNYARSVLRMGGLIANHNFLTEARNAGMGEFFTEKPIVKDGVEYKTRISSKNSQTMAPLNDLYTTPEIKTAFEKYLDPAPTSATMQAWMTVNGAVKYAKTVGSLTTHVRNFGGGLMFSMANGHWRVGEFGTAFKTVLTNIGAMNSQEYRSYYQKLTELGVVRESARGGELRDVIRDAQGQDFNQFTQNLAGRVKDKILRGATEVYMAEDDVRKVYAFENEKARYRQAKPEWTTEQVEQRAAEVVRDTDPTYSLTPKIVKELRKFPAVGTFVSFPAEVMRTGYKRLRLTEQELRDPDLRSIGAERLVGQLMAYSITAGVASGTNHLTGYTAQKIEDLRHFVYEWSQNSELAVIGHSENDEPLVIDFSYTDPHEYLKKPLIAMMRGENWENSFWDAASELGEPFLSEEILMQKFFDVIRNTKPTGGRVYNPEAPASQRNTAIARHFIDALEPGTITSFQRVWKGVKNQKEQYGQSYDPAREALATFTGMRITPVNIQRSLQFKASDIYSSMRDSEQILTSTIARKDEITEEQLREAYETSNQQRQEIFNEMVEVVNAARRLGTEPQEIRKILLQSNLPKKQIGNIIKQRYAPYVPSPQFFKNLGQSMTPVPNLEERKDLTLELFKAAKSAQ